MSEQAAAVATLARDLLADGKVEELVEQLADPDVLDLWDDPGVVAGIAEAHGAAAASSCLMDLAVLRRPDAALVLPVPGLAGGIVRNPGASELVYLGDGDAWIVGVGDLDVSPAQGLDPESGWRRVPGLPATATLTAYDVPADVLQSRAARFLAHELVGVASGALELALGHVRDRRQFGVPIGTFQAVRHRLADAHVLLVAARELLTALGPDAGSDVHRLVLKPAAGAAALAAVVAAQQVCGGMGFTEEFGLHRYVRKAYVLDSLYVGSEAADGLLGAMALDGTVLPDRLVELG